MRPTVFVCDTKSKTQEEAGIASSFPRVNCKGKNRLQNENPKIIFILRHSFSRQGIPESAVHGKTKSTDMSINGTASSSHSIQPLKLLTSATRTYIYMLRLCPSLQIILPSILIQVLSSHALLA